MEMQYKKIKTCSWLVLGGFLLNALIIAGVSSGADGDDANSWTAPPSAARKKNPLSPAPEVVSAGREVYAQNCLQCHGEGGRGDGPAGRDLQPLPSDLTDNQVQQESDGALFWKTTSGRKPMPAFRSCLDDRERWEAVTYIRVLCGSKQRAKKDK